VCIKNILLKRKQKKAAKANIDGFNAIYGKKTKKYTLDTKLSFWILGISAATLISTWIIEFVKINHKSTPSEIIVPQSLTESKAKQPEQHNTLSAVSVQKKSCLKQVIQHKSEPKPKNVVKSYKTPFKNKED